MGFMTIFFPTIQNLEKDAFFDYKSMGRPSLYKCVA